MACDPITAIELSFAAFSGSCPPAFFNSTAPCSSTFCAIASSVATMAGASDVTAGGWLKTPTWYMACRIRVAMSSTRDCGTSPDATAASKAVALKNSLSGCS